ncbi:lysM and putative peptidoglycan-binding domain-containing protein 1 isoform X1 [Gopherus flavomarginatus]|uniref:lysM and putative peptidoglycan-binding domain-containing protein 1 isoform X1 n=1 Tax=Gopherus flavomarginatus TaxID=286002 RepID=UPI0021CBC7DA|nr:lysM and putative peptidoglycan-binding domain-containing protein 1 isoform X1 [Gopherus flavomarginatus]
MCAHSHALSHFLFLQLSVPVTLTGDQFLLQKSPWRLQPKLYHLQPAHVMEQIKRANRLYTSDSIFLKTTLHIPVLVEPKQMVNGLNLEEEEEEAEEGARRPTTGEDKPMLKNGSVASTGTTPRHDLSATDFLRKLDLEISLSKKAAVKKLREGEIAIARAEPEASSTVSYQSEPSPHAQQRALLGPVPLTKSIRAATLRDQEDEIFKL